METNAIQATQFAALLDELAGIRKELEKISEMMALSLDGEKSFRVSGQITTREGF